MNLLPFQRRDFAAAALRDGCVLSLEQGLGKSFAAFAIPYIWRSPRVLIVAPGDLHTQLKQTGAKHFGVALTRLERVADLYTHGLHLPAEPLADKAMPRYYVVSYEALTLNGADEAPESSTTPSRRSRARLIEAKSLARAHMLAKLTGTKPNFREYFAGIGQTRSDITCIWARLQLLCRSRSVA
jgi:hypothetical protein